MTITQHSAQKNPNLKIWVSKVIYEYMAILWESIQFNPKNQSKIQLDGKKGSKLTK